MKILLAESKGFAPEALAKLRSVGDVVAEDMDRASLLRAIVDADILWVRLRHQIDVEVLAAASHLKIIASPTTGLNHIDLVEAKRRGVQVISLRGEEEFLKDIRATAELTIALILSLIRHIPAATDDVRRGQWNRDAFQGRELYGKTAGVIGYGRLGRIVARYLSAFDMRVLVCDPSLDVEELEPNIIKVSLEKLLAEADLVTMHVNLCEETAGFFGREQFAAMKPGAWFINTARGELIDEAALLEALRSHRLAGAALDVVADEDARGMAGRPLIEYAKSQANLVLTPHLGGCTRESMEKTEVFLAKRVVQAVSGIVCHR